MLDSYIIEYCAPTLAGIKTANLFTQITEDTAFSHEIGLFLGYPPEDVRCFMKNSPQGVKYTGPWKAYSNQEEAEKKSRLYRRCTGL